MPYGGGYSDLSSKNNKLNRYNFIKNSKKGAILIEFAFAAPVLFSLIYYIQDLSHLKQMQERMKFVAMEMVSILQNISQNRADKAISILDIQHTIATAYLSFFPGKTFYNTFLRTSPLGYSSIGNIYCIKGLSNGKASVLWGERWHSAISTYEPSFISIGGQDSRSLIKFATNVAPSDIYKDLKINEGEIKVIIEAGTHCFGGYAISPGKTVAQAGGAQKVYGFYIYPFKETFDSIFLPTVVIFTPKPGLFSETPPR